MEVDISDMPQLTSEEATTVTPEEDDMLTDDPTLVAGEMAQLQVTPPESHEPDANCFSPIMHDSFASFLVPYFVVSEVCAGLWELL